MRCMGTMSDEAKIAARRKKKMRQMLEPKVSQTQMKLLPHTKEEGTSHQKGPVFQDQHSPSRLELHFII